MILMEIVVMKSSSVVQRCIKLSNSMTVKWIAFGYGQTMNLFLVP